MRQWPCILFQVVRIITTSLLIIMLSPGQK